MAVEARFRQPRRDQRGIIGQITAAIAQARLDLNDPYLFLRPTGTHVDTAEIQCRR